MTVTVYSKLTCVQCDSTYRAMITAGINFEVIAIEGDRDAINYIMGLGHRQAPVVVAGDKHWSGYRPDQISNLARDLTELGVELTPLSMKEDKDVIDAKIKDIKSQIEEAMLAPSLT